MATTPDNLDYYLAKDLGGISEEFLKLYGRGIFEPVTETLEPKSWAISNGGPSSYYDFPADWTTLNDYIEHKSTHQWKEHSFHLGNITKAGCRWGDKDGTTKEYDARKIVYSGLRLLLMLKGKTVVKEYLMDLLKDDQFM